MHNAYYQIRFRLLISITMLISCPSCCTVDNNETLFGKVLFAETDPYWVQLVPDHAPSPRVVTCMAYDPVRECLVLFGGAGDYDVALNDTWEFDGMDWKFMETDVSPPARFASGLCYFPSLGGCVLFGGKDNGKFNDTWLYIDGAWTQLDPIHKPTARSVHGMVYDAHLGSILLFGGFSTDYLGDFWSFDGYDWNLIFDDGAGPISQRANPMMIYDTHREKTVLFGGWYGVSNKNDTWEYDGVQWIKINTPNQVNPIRINFGLTYDKFQKKTVLFGGSYLAQPYPVYLNDTWEYYGTDWHEITINNSPSPRHYGSFTYMDAYYKSVYFGGRKKDYTRTDETFAYSAMIHQTPSMKATSLIMLAILLSLILLFYVGYQRKSKKLF